MKSLIYAKSVETIDEKVVEVIRQSRKSLLFDHNNAWAKKEKPNLDVTVGSYDGVEMCKLTGLYILNNVLSIEFVNEKIGS